MLFLVVSISTPLLRRGGKGKGGELERGGNEGIGKKMGEGRDRQKWERNEKGSEGKVREGERKKLGGNERERIA